MELVRQSHPCVVLEAILLNELKHLLGKDLTVLAGANKVLREHVDDEFG